ncbi:MAG: DUF1289 domain-containing protein [Pseudomonadota bacterium]
MTLASPCVGIFKLDDTTGWCVGCARTGDEIADWRAETDGWRAAVWDALPARFEQLGVSCRRLPWDTSDIHRFVVRSLREAAGTWVVGVVGAVAEFTARSGEPTEVEVNGSSVVAVTAGGKLRFVIDDDVRALTFDPPETDLARQRIVLSVKRERGRSPVADAIADLGVDRQAIDSRDQTLRLFDLGLGRKEARFCVRCTPGSAETALIGASGQALSAELPRIGPVLLQESPPRVVESALGRIEVLGPIQRPGGPPVSGPDTHLLPDHLATGRALPVGMELPRAYLPGAVFYPAG